MTLARLKAFFQSVPSRIVGSHIELNRYHVTRLSPSAAFPVDTKLEERIAAAKSALPVNNVKPLRVKREPADCRFPSI